MPWIASRAAALIVWAPLITSASAQHHEAAAAGTVQLGTITFPTSGSPSAQPSFIRGVLYLHSFEYDDAARAFREAQRSDPNFVMAYWGEALTYTHPVWIEQNLGAARAVLDRLAPTRAARRAKAPTQRERDYLDAVEQLYGDGDKDQRDTLFSLAMERMTRAYPNDDEARAFYALSLLGLQQHGRDTANYMRAAALMEDVFARNPRHPGAAHYLIHAYDDPEHAPRGLRAARAYGAIAPGAAHALHMTSHIFVSLGLWDDVTAMNVRARNAVGRGGHYSQWLEYGYLQQGRFADAKAQVIEIIRQAKADATPYNTGYRAAMLAAYMIDSEDWDSDVARFARDSVREADHPRTPFSADDDALAFMVAWSEIHRGNLAPARLVQQQIEARVAAARAQARGGYVAGLGASDVMATMLKAAILDAEGARDSAITVARTAVRKDDTYPFEFGPPATIKPPREFLGDLLLAAKRPDEARAAYEHALEKTPNRSRAVLGLARANAALGRREDAATVYGQFLRNWRGADASRPEVSEAGRFAKR